jgi:hypothetical protein
LTTAGGEPRRTREEIFSNVKAGMMNPLVVELKHSWNFPRGYRSNERPITAIVPSRLFAGAAIQAQSFPDGKHFVPHCTRHAALLG